MTKKLSFPKWRVWAIALTILFVTVGIFYLAVQADNAAEQKAAEKETRKKAKQVAAQAAYVAANSPTIEEIQQELEYPSVGSAFLQKGVKIKIWLDPKKSSTTGMGSVTYELEGHSSIRFTDDFSGRRDREWWKFPVGRYIVTTTSENEIHFQWWKKGR